MQLVGHIWTKFKCSITCPVLIFNQIIQARFCAKYQYSPLSNRKTFHHFQEHIHQESWFDRAKENLIFFCRHLLILHDTFNKDGIREQTVVSKVAKELRNNSLKECCQLLNTSFIFAAAADAKSLQSCPTLCDPIDGSPTVSPIPGILQARTLEWLAISFSNAWKWKVKVKSLSRVRLFKTPGTAAYQAPPSMGFSRQEYWSGVPSPSPPTIIYFF